jgi:hypothetical protein
MRPKFSRLVIAAIAATAAISAGCSSDDDGTLQQTWSIEGSTDPNTCTRVGAAQMRVVVLDPGLFVRATRFAPCTDFSTAITLDDNNYTATATFLDANGVAVSDTRTLSVFAIRENVTTRLHIDFPVGSFLPR